MSISYGVNLDRINSPAQIGIITDQLSVYLDAGIKSSYSGGSTWKDLSGNSRNVTLYSLGGTTYSATMPIAPTFNTERKGHFDFDGINDWGIFASQFTLSGTHSVCVWAKSTSTSSDKGLLSHCSGGPVNVRYGMSAGKMQYYYYSGAWQNVVGTNNINDGTWKNLVWTKTGTALKMYTNAVLDSSHTLIASITENIRSIGVGWGPCNSISYGAGTDSYGQVFPGSIGCIMIYNKELSLSEIESNYNNMKNRFKP